MSAITERIKLGDLFDRDGVPLGLVNWMVFNQRHTIRACRIGDRTGYLWFRLRLRSDTNEYLNIWTDHP